MPWRRGGRNGEKRCARSAPVSCGQKYTSLPRLTNFERITWRRSVMRIGILGTGTVGQTIGTRLVQLGHDVKLGSRTATNETAVKWVAGAGEHATQGTFA